MKHHLPLPLPLPLIALLALMLSGCPDTRMPKVPPKVPVPKAADSAVHSPPGDARRPAPFGRLSA
jgi:hypothetical protein